MCNPLHAHHYADAAILRQVDIVENVAVARDTYRVRFHCGEMAEQILPGQFLMVRLAGCDDPLIGRPLAVYDIGPDVAGEPAAIDLIYHVKGKFTTRLASCVRGQQLTVWGPLGNGFPPLACDHLIMVAGGVGQTPLLTLAKEHLGLQRFGRPPRETPRVPRVTLCFRRSRLTFSPAWLIFKHLAWMCSWLPTMARVAITAASRTCWNRC